MYSAWNIVSQNKTGVTFVLFCFSYLPITLLNWNGLVVYYPEKNCYIHHLFARNPQDLLAVVLANQEWHYISLNWIILWNETHIYTSKIQSYKM